MHKIAVKLHSFFFFQNGCVGGAPGCSEIAQIIIFFFRNGVLRSRLGSAAGCAEIAHFLFFLFFFQIAARQVAVKLHTLFFFLKMAASGRVGNEIWQVHQVARKLHICVFFFFQIAVFVAARGQPTAQARNSTRPRLGKKQGVNTKPAVPLCCKAVC